MTGIESTDTTADTTTVPAPTGPRIEVIGDASPEHVAALVAVLSGIGGGDAAPEAPRSRWASREMLVRAPLRPAPGAWRAAAFPH